MGVDSGLPDFRGTEGFWRAYPALGTAEIRFEESLRRRVFGAIQRSHGPSTGIGWICIAALNRTVASTSCVLGGKDALRRVRIHEQRRWTFPEGGTEDRVAECHGSIHWLQCVDECSRRTWPADDVVPVLDERNFRLSSPVPICPSCGAVARPNILMFNDSHWVEDRTNQQIRHLETWIEQCQKLVAVEVGAGRAITTVRRFGEHYADRLICINPRDFKISEDRGVEIAGAALNPLERIEMLLLSGLRET
jgi:NAD-dependent SIR2 family protein deacetylase